jgi:nucleotide-binding universal stress UspA family protein
MSGPILHPTDFSPASAPAFRRAIAEARATRAELLIAHVVAPVVPIAGDGYVSPQIYQQMSDSARRWARKQLDRLIAKARASRVRARGMLLDGLAHERIVRLARARHARLIVMGTHGRTGVARFFLGSVAARVTATAPSRLASSMRRHMAASVRRKGALSAAPAAFTSRSVPSRAISFTHSGVVSTMARKIASLWRRS